MYQSNRIRFDAIRSVDSATFTGSYIAFGSALTSPARILHIINNSNEDAIISFDGGTTDNIYVPAGHFVLYDFGTNRGASSDALELPGGIGMVIKGSAGVGLVYAMIATASTPNSTPQSF